jgi:uncharacterized Fe-S radical SAM superfamily protein PflX
LEWFRDNFLRLVQSALCVLPKFRDQPVWRRRRSLTRWTCGHHGGSPVGRLPQRQLTPEHVVPQILEALAIAIDRGSRPPLVYNTLAYDSLESIQLMEGIVDVYMPDFKLWHTENCRNYLVASDYADAARTAIAAMYAQVGELKVDEEGLALRGVLVRHLVMPGLLDDTHEIMHWLAALSPGTYVNVMDQILSRP